MDTPKFSGLKNTYLLSHGFCGSEILARTTWILCFKAAIKVSAEATFWSWGLTAEGPTPVLTHIVVGRMQFLKVCWNEILCTLLALGWSWLVPYHVGFSNMTAYFIKARREFANKLEITIFWKLVMEMIFHYLSFILLVRVKSLGPAYA